MTKMIINILNKAMMNNILMMNSDYYIFIIYMNKNKKKEIVNKVWNKALKNNEQYGYDAYGNKIKKNDYGKNKDTGWEIDHIVPKSRGGKNNISNL